MTAYSTVNDFFDLIKSPSISEDIDSLLMQASIKIDDVTFNRITRCGFDNLTPFQQECVKKAVCYQAQYIGENGYDSEDAQSFSVGDISITAKQNKSRAETLGLNSICYSLLKQSGLMTRVL